MSKNLEQAANYYIKHNMGLKQQGIGYCYIGKRSERECLQEKVESLFDPWGSYGGSGHETGQIRGCYRVSILDVVGYFFASFN